MFKLSKANVPNIYIQNNCLRFNFRQGKWNEAYQRRNHVLYVKRKQSKSMIYYNYEQEKNSIFWPGEHINSVQKGSNTSEKS